MPAVWRTAGFIVRIVLHITYCTFYSFPRVSSNLTRFGIFTYVSVIQLEVLCLILLHAALSKPAANLSVPESAVNVAINSNQNRNCSRRYALDYSISLHHQVV